MKTYVEVVDAIEKHRSVKNADECERKNGN